MSDLRLTPANAHVAHISLEGQVKAERFTEGDSLATAWPIASILDAPAGRKQRELVFGERFRRLEARDGFVFGFAERDGYTGYVEAQMLTDTPMPTHVVSARASHALADPDIKTRGEHFPLSTGALVHVLSEDNGWSRIASPTGAQRYAPTQHLRALDQPETDPVGVARRLLGTPYVWGGNSAFGMDCSGLVQRAFLACGWTCPGDSDLQARMPGTALSNDTALEAGDLIFWKGHVAMATSADQMIHATAFAMATIEEPTQSALHRIAASDTGPETLRLRPDHISSV